uniref:Uncharacterized protein n=1 Tax=Ralstonia syzygii R24 TaxID=907261 RepID=G3A5H4_9RALS|nr:hypothetical protein RALSY_30979 [Ralstonia syzygii R24]
MRDLPRRANVPTGVARTDRASSSACGERLSTSLNYREYDLAGGSAAQLESQRNQQHRGSKARLPPHTRTWRTS